MITEQRKALEKAAFWQARKDGIPYRKAKRLAKEATWRSTTIIRDAIANNVD